MDTKETSNVPKDTSLLLAEYNALRSEIVKRMDVENQLATFTVIVFGTILGIGLQNKTTSALILLYPTLATFFAVGWSHSDYMTLLIGTYIKERMEATEGADKMGWEHYLAKNRVPRYYWAMRGIFISTELIAIVLGISIAPLNATFVAVLLGQPMTSFNFIVNILVCIAIVSLLLTSFLIFYQVPLKHLKLSTDQGQNS